MAIEVKKIPANKYVDGSVGPGSAHRLVYEGAFGKVPEGWHVHHVNNLKYDNSLDNLIALPRKFHHWLHKESDLYVSLVYRGIMTKDFVSGLFAAYESKRFSLSVRLSSIVESFMLENKPGNFDKV